MAEPPPTASSSKAKASELSERAREATRLGRRDVASRLLQAASAHDLVAIECELLELHMEIRELAAMVHELLARQDGRVTEREIDVVKDGTADFAVVADELMDAITAAHQAGSTTYVTADGVRIAKICPVAPSFAKVTHHADGSTDQEVHLA